MNLGIATRYLDVRVGSGVDAQCDVLADGALVEGGFLRDEAELGAVGGGVEGGDIGVIVEDCAVGGSVEAFEEGNCCRFATALVACQCLFWKQVWS